MILPKTEQALRAEVDTALDTMRSDGTFQRIIRRYMPFLAD
jgi:ABC-type amino acid transport substrate-binding protein